MMAWNVLPGGQVQMAIKHAIAPADQGWVALALDPSGNGLMVGSAAVIGWDAASGSSKFAGVQTLAGVCKTSLSRVVDAFTFVVTTVFLRTL